MCKPALKEKAKNLVMDMLIEARQKGYTFNDIAEEIGASPKSIQHYLYGEQIPSLPVAFGIHRTVKSKAFASAIAKEANGIFIELPKISKSFSFISSQTAKVMRETADVIEAVGKALEDNQLTEDEKRTVVKEIDEAIEELLKLKHCIEVGN